MTPAHSSRPSPAWLYAFAAVQVGSQAVLFLPVGGARTGLRVLAFASSVVMLALIPAGGSPHPLRWAPLAVVGLMAVGLVYPSANSPSAGLASLAMNLAIWAPLLWVGRIAVTPVALSRLLLLLWGYHTASATAGVLQVYDPDRFAPDPTFIENMMGEYAEGLKVTLDDGRRIYRPFGLTDSPGGAAGSGAFAATAGLVIAAGRGSWLLRAAAAVSAAVGMFCIYICQFRSALIVTTLGLGFLVALTALRGLQARAGLMAGLVAAAVLGGFAWATAVGSGAVITRLETLVQEDAVTTYQKNRGHFLTATLDEIPNYPLGAGLGRWGMACRYFGNESNPDSPPLWVEIQATGWLYDGGLPLLVVGYWAVAAACVLSVRIALRSRDDRLADAAGVVAATNCAALFATFGYPFFISQGGLMFWVLNAALYAAAAARPGPGSAIR